MLKSALSSLALFALASVSSAVSAQTTVTPGASEGSQTDLFNGATVGSTSSILAGFTAADAFGSVTSGGQYTESQAGGHVIFANSGANFINFSTAAPVTIGGFNIFASGDGVGNSFRGFDTVSLFATIGGTPTLLGTASYDAALGPVTITSLFAPITASSFEFTSSNANGGGRLIEIDAIAAPGAVPEPATWAMMLVGFGMVGFGLRYRRKNQTARVSFA